MFSRKSNLRMKYLLILFIILSIIILLKVLYIEIFKNNMLSRKASLSWSKDLPVESERGKILDRNYNELVTNKISASLYVVPNELKNKKDVCIKLSSILNCECKDIYNHLTKNVAIEKIFPEGVKLSKEKIEKINKLNIKGIFLLSENKRYYKYGKTLSHVLGYVGDYNQGLSGIESYYDKYLKSSYGAVKYYADRDGNKLNISDDLVNGKEGFDVRLTINMDIQKSIERELDNVVYKFDPDKALALVMNPETGEILAMSSRPNFNPNNYKKYKSNVLNRNLPIFSTYEPGSTQKIISMTAAVNENVLDIDKDRFYDSGSVKVSGVRIGCWKSGGHGDQSFMEVFQNSCNPGFVEIGKRLGKDKLFSYLYKFGFGTKTGIDLEGEGKGILFDLKNVHDLELATTAFGQGISVTPIQQVRAVSAIVNGGYLLKPYIVKDIIDSKTGTVVKSFHKKVLRKIIKDETSKTMRRALENVVAKGGGKAAYIEGYRVGGKTGTAQKQENGKYLVGNYIMSFMSVVPANKPKAVLYLAIDNPKHTPKLSSYTTTPVARRILLDIIDALEIKKQKGQIPKDLEWNDTEYVTIPNVIGKKLKDAKNKLKDFTLVYSGSGKKIEDISPKPGTRIPKDSTLRILLN